MVDRKPHRSLCSICQEVLRVNFAVTAEVWKLAVHPSQLHSILCLTCFTRVADERGVEWERGIVFMPVSRVTHDRWQRDGFPDGLPKWENSPGGTPTREQDEALVDGVIAAQRAGFAWYCLRCRQPHNGDRECPRCDRASSVGGEAVATPMRRFTMYRKGDLSATHNDQQSNPPDVPQFEGVVFSDGTVAIRWLTALRSTSVWADLGTAMGVHGHPEERYQSEIVWHDNDRAPSPGPGAPRQEKKDG